MEIIFLSFHHLSRKGENYGVAIGITGIQMGYLHWSLGIRVSNFHV